jgi:hypothetical protein
MKNLIIVIISFCVACSSVNIKGVNKAPDFSISKYKKLSFYEVISSGDAIGPDYSANLI